MSTLGWIICVAAFFVIFWIVAWQVWSWQLRREDRIDDSTPIPTQHISHPVFGHLVPDEWGDLMTFRRFEFLRLFWMAEGSRHISSLSAHERVCVENWSEYMVPLARICRRSAVHESLRSMGIFEVWLETPGKESPTTSQEAAYQHLLAHEKMICENVVDALARYYRVLKEEMPDWFDKDYPFNPDAEQLARLVDFDGITILRTSVNGVSPLEWSWRPAWDEEHGLRMVVFRDRVIMLDQDVEWMLKAPTEFLKDSVWKREHMTDAERTAVDEFIAGLKPKDANE